TLASYWHEKRDDEKAMSYVDKALDVFETYVPNPEFDTCTGALLARLKFSAGLNRVYRVIERSEKLCTDERFRVQRDKEFMDFIEGRRSDAIALYKMLISVREQQHGESGFPTDEFYSRLSQAYLDNLESKNAASALSRILMGK